MSLKYYILENREKEAQIKLIFLSSLLSPCKNSYIFLLYCSLFEFYKINELNFSFLLKLLKIILAVFINLRKIIFFSKINSKSNTIKKLKFLNHFLL